MRYCLESNQHSVWHKGHLNVSNCYYLTFYNILMNIHHCQSLSLFKPTFLSFKNMGYAPVRSIFLTPILSVSFIQQIRVISLLGMELGSGDTATWQARSLHSKSLPYTGKTNNRQVMTIGALRRAGPMEEQQGELTYTGGRWASWKK